MLFARALWPGDDQRLFRGSSSLLLPRQGLRGPAQRVWGWDEWVGVGGAAEDQDSDTAHAMPTGTARFAHALGAEDQGVHKQDAGRSPRPGAHDSSAASRRVLSGARVAMCMQHVHTLHACV